MGAMTVDADRRGKISLEKHIEMDALKRLRILVEVASSAGFGSNDSEVPLVREISLRMLLGRKAEVTIRAPQPVVDRRLEDLLCNLQGLSAAVFERQRKTILMTAETGLPGFLHGLNRMRAVAVDADDLF
jgi:hypothetical protein